MIYHPMKLKIFKIFKIRVIEQYIFNKAEQNKENQYCYRNSSFRYCLKRSQSNLHKQFNKIRSISQVNK
jgi:hypothetical protein